MAVVNAYIDSSVLLRVVLRAPGQLVEWNEIQVGIASELLALEVRRALDRLWLTNQITDDELSEKTAESEAILRRIDLVELDRLILDRAGQPFPTPLATLDALHLATAILFRDQQSRDEPPFLFATHDRELARAARALNFDVIGVPA